jgi:hypothetical protein
VALLVAPVGEVTTDEARHCSVRLLCRVDRVCVSVLLVCALKRVALQGARVCESVCVFGNTHTVGWQAYRETITM